MKHRRKGTPYSKLAFIEFTWYRFPRKISVFLFLKYLQKGFLCDRSQRISAPEHLVMMWQWQQILTQHLFMHQYHMCFACFNSLIFTTTLWGGTLIFLYLSTCVETGIECLTNLAWDHTAHQWWNWDLYAGVRFADPPFHVAFSLLPVSNSFNFCFAILLLPSLFLMFSFLYWNENIDL